MCGVIYWNGNFLFCFWKQKFRSRVRARARADKFFEEVHVLVQVEVVGLKKFLGYVNDRDVNPYLYHYLELILN